MLFAWDKRTHIDVSATEAKRHGSYICPTCKQEVVLRDGEVRVRHFAHRSGRADPDCDRYYPGSGIGNPLSLQGGEHGTARIERIPVDPLALSLRVEEPSKIARGEQRRWRLVLTLPRAPTSSGRLRLPTGKISRDVRLFSLEHAPLEIEVSPNLARFGADWVSDEVDHDYRDVVTSRIDGLAQDRAHTFAVTSAKVKPMTSGVTWGDSYFLIYKTGHLDVPATLNALRLAPNEGWSACLITLPIASIPEIADWLHTVCGLRVQEGTRQWGILYPPPIRVDPDGNIEVADSTHIVAGFVETSDSGEQPATLSIEAGAERQHATLHRGQWHLFEITRGSVEARGPLRFQWGNKGLPGIASATRQDLFDALPAVSLRVRSKTDERDTRIPLHSADARRALDRIRDGDGDLLAITAPQGIRGCLEQRKPKGPWQTILTFDAQEPDTRLRAWSVPPSHVAAISAALGDRTCDTHLSFGTFGQYTALAISPRVVAPIGLAAHLRRRILWYCRANGHLGGASPGALARYSDNALLNVLRRAQPRRHLVAYRNLLLKQLATTAGNVS